MTRSKESLTTELLELRERDSEFADTLLAINAHLDTAERLCEANGIEKGLATIPVDLIRGLVSGLCAVHE